MSTNRSKENSLNYVNSWENVKAYVNFVIVKNPILLQKFNEDIINPFDNIKYNEQEKIIKLQEWIEENLNISTTFSILKKFIKNQLEQSEAAKLAHFHIKNTYSQIEKKTRNNYLESVTKLVNDTQMSVAEKRVVLENHFKRNNKDYVSYARFSKTIKHLGQGLFLEANSAFTTVKEYTTEINWNSVQNAMAFYFDTSMTQKKDILEKINKKMIKIIRSGASDNVKIDSLFTFLIDSLKAYKGFWGYKRLHHTLTQILEILFDKSKDGRYTFTNTFDITSEQPTFKRK